MPTYDMGFLIREIRRMRGITQEQLCIGLCSVSSLSRLERGLYTPTNYLFTALLGRLGYYAESHSSAYLGKEDFRLWEKREKLNTALFNGDAAAIESLVTELWGTKEFDHGFGLQHLLCAKVVLSLLKMDASKNAVDFEECMRMIHESLNITLPVFNESKIGNYMLSHTEIRIISCLGGVYFYQEEYEKCAQVYFALKESIEKFCIDPAEKARCYPGVLINLAQTLYMLERYEEAISVCEQGRKISIEGRMTWYIPDFFVYITLCLVAMGRKEEARPMFRRAYYTALSFERQSSADILSQHFSEAFAEEEIERVWNVMQIGRSPKKDCEGEERRCCPQCGSEKVYKSGNVRGKQRYKCKECGKQFVAEKRWGKTEKKLIAALLYRSGLSLRSIAGLLGISAATVGEWVKQYADMGKSQMSKGVTVMELPDLGGQDPKVSATLLVRSPEGNIGVTIPEL